MTVDRPLVAQIRRGAARRGRRAWLPADRPQHAGGKGGLTLRIANGLVELSPEHVVSTTLYNGQFPGPLLRLKEGRRVVVDVHNDTDTPELVHWHGLFVPSEVDGAAEEGSPYLPRAGRAAFRSCRSRRGCAFTTRMWPPAAT